MIQDLCPRKQVNTAELYARIGHDLTDNIVQLLFVDAKGRRFAAHPHRATLRFRARVDTNRDSGLTTESPADRADSIQFQGRLDMNLADVTGQNELQICLGLTRAREKDLFRRTKGSLSKIKLAP